MPDLAWRCPESPRGGAIAAGLEHLFARSDGRVAEGGFNIGSDRRTDVVAADAPVGGNNAAPPPQKRRTGSCANSVTGTIPTPEMGGGIWGKRKEPFTAKIRIEISASDDQSLILIFLNA